MGQQHNVQHSGCFAGVRRIIEHIYCKGQQEYIVPHSECRSAVRSTMNTAHGTLQYKIQSSSYPLVMSSTRHAPGGNVIRGRATELPSPFVYFAPGGGRAVKQQEPASGADLLFFLTGQRWWRSALLIMDLHWGMCQKLCLPFY